MLIEKAPEFFHAALQSPPKQSPHEDKLLVSHKRGGFLQTHFWDPAALDKRRKESLSCNTDSLISFKLVTHKGNNEALNYFISSNTH